MMRVKVTIPVGADEVEPAPRHELDVLYVRENLDANDTVKDELGYIQSGRNHPGGGTEILYSLALSKNVEAFAKYLQAELSDQYIDTIVLAPSSRNFHAPWCEAASAMLDVEMIAPFCKSDGFFAGEGRTYAEVVDALTLKEDKLPRDIGKRRSILIFDDTISNGYTAAAIISCLRPRAHADAVFFLACVLRLPGVE